jgi:hypothetical protein
MAFLQSNGIFTTQLNFCFLFNFYAKSEKCLWRVFFYIYVTYPFSCSWIKQWDFQELLLKLELELNPVIIIKICLTMKRVMFAHFSLLFIFVVLY